MAKLAVAAGLACLLSALPLAAQEVDDATRASARQLGYSGVEAYQAQSYAAASEKLERAFHVLEVPSLGLWSARALVKVGKLVEARERYLKVGRLPTAGGDADVQRKAQAEAAVEVEALAPKIPSIVLQIEGTDAAGVTLTIDGASVSSALVGEPRPVNPGTHTVIGVRGEQRQQATVTVSEGDQRQATLRFTNEPVTAAPKAAPPPAAAPAAPPAEPERAGGSLQRTAGWAAIAVGGAGVVLGGVTGVMLLGKRSDLKDNSRCRDTACGPSQSTLVESYNSLRPVSTIGFVAGGVVAAAGVALLLTAPAPRPGASAALFVGPGSLGLKGAF